MNGKTHFPIVIFRFSSAIGFHKNCPVIEAKQMANENGKMTNGK